MRIRSLQYSKFQDPTLNFSELTPSQEKDLFDDTVERQIDSDIDKEILLLKALKALDSDKERAVFLLEILREYGFQLDYDSIATALNIKWRWFMRVKKNVKAKVQLITTNT